MHDYLGISTAWYSGRVDDGNALLDCMAESGLTTLEIDYRVTKAMLAQMWPRLHRGDFRVLTVHNYCPTPPGHEGSDNIASLFNPASLDESERDLAVEYSLKSIQMAAELEAKVVVFHLGGVEMPCEMQQLFKFFDNDDLDNPEYVALYQHLQKERSRLVDAYISPLMRTLDLLHEEASRLGVLIGIENRYRISQIPFGDEFDAIFKEFAGGRMRYWHDVGHAEIYHRLGIFNHEKDFLIRFGDHLAGMHLHDVKGIKDHLAPGMGSFDFNRLQPFLKSDSMRILEVHKHARVTDVHHGLTILQDAGLV